ncbi:family 2 encapsulin nanocompartment cargo protein terpene cyclase [Nocardia arthritidis]|uniref:2-methylisoborneol synthase n=1 Tax=Nocardia arthritidis TaxID=228602 RepID=A0A6G9YDE4_9NOCA|nr:family 2 encapsulin nanocompartment cargo protein terpene cyclase [Nocardia arthritidis]QIS11249.1 hypothetical protein F5544_16850 [Nocardia arthritidis]
MSVFSRAAARPATSDVAAAVAALLADFSTTAPADPFATQPETTGDVTATPQPPVASQPPVPPRLLGPSGLGAAALRLPSMEAALAQVGESVTAPAESADISNASAAAETDVVVGTEPSASRIPLGPTGLGAATAYSHRVRLAPSSGGAPRGPQEWRPPSDPTRSGTPAADPSPRPRFPTGPTGLGTASAGIRRPPAEAASPIPALYCPPPVRDNPELAELVNDGLIAWAAEIGLYEGRLDELRDADFGRLIMLAHPDSDDPDRLLAAAKCAVTEWSVDDYYCEEDAPDTAPDGSPSVAWAELGPKLEMAAAAMDPVHLPARYAPELEKALQADPILRAFRTSFEHMAHYANPAQLARLRTEIAGWFIALGAEAGWRAAKRMPPVWEYLTNRQPHSFLPCMAPIDAVGGYELPAAEYTDPGVRRVTTTAALAAQMVNDLYSMAREDLSGGREFNLPTVLSAREGCTRHEAVQRTAEVHDELMHRFEREATVLAAAGSPELRRFLTGLWAWMGGNRAWHAGSKRYQ